MIVESTYISIASTHIKPSKHPIIYINICIVSNINNEPTPSRNNNTKFTRHHAIHLPAPEQTPPITEQCNNLHVNKFHM